MWTSNSPDATLNRTNFRRICKNKNGDGKKKKYFVFIRLVPRALCFCTVTIYKKTLNTRFGQGQESHGAFTYTPVV